MRSILLLAVLALGGCSFAHVNDDLEARPDTVVGTGAKVIYPGQPGPAVGPRSSSSSSSGSPSGAGSPPGDELTMIGGASEEVSESVRRRETPLGPLTVLFGYPFWIFGKKLEKKADQAAQSMGEPAKAEGRAQTPDDLERARLERENAELEQALLRRSEAGGPKGGTIADELAALRAALDPTRTPPRGDLGASSERLLDAADRDRDGRTDFWVYEGPEGQTREALDEDGDGRADRIHVYGRDRGLLRSEEDLDHDGRADTVTLYEDGEVVRKRADTNRDGIPDAWSFYRGGELLRHEVDRDGDGFRDLTLFYDAGTLLREEHDENGDGRPDVRVHYRDGEVSSREEDLDFDGTPDVISHYEGGKLVRKEVRSEELLRPAGGGGT